MLDPRVVHVVIDDGRRAHRQYERRDRDGRRARRARRSAAPSAWPQHAINISETAHESRRDAKPGDSSAQSDYDRATEDMRNAEKALEQFNNKYGKDIEPYASRLIDQYKAEKESHEWPLSEARNRVDNCKKVDNMSY